MTTDELITELLKEIRADRILVAQRQKEITERLDGFGAALTSLGSDFREFRAHVLEHEDTRGKELRAVADFVGMTDKKPRARRNGGG